MNDIKNNIDFIRNEIDIAATKIGVKSNDITLIAVSKTKSALLINEAIDYGITDIGENYVQEILEKYADLKSANLHFIGHLQSNKAKHIVPIASLIHSVDSLNLLKEINRQSEKINKVSSVLLEVNISNEDNKFGFNENNLLDALENIGDFKNIKIKGLMGMAPITNSKEETRPYFNKLKILFDKLPKDMQIHLSMGMTSDFREAIYEGSNMVRIGTAIFGQRK